MMPPFPICDQLHAPVPETLLGDDNLVISQHQQPQNQILPISTPDLELTHNTAIPLANNSAFYC